MSKKIAVINGPNLNLLGKREPDDYGTETLDSILSGLKQEAKELGISITAYQSNSEGEIVDTIQKTCSGVSGIIINPGGYTHTSVAIRDALECYDQPVIEVHLSNVFSREEFRKHSFLSDIAVAVVSGLGAYGYELALYGAERHLQK